MSVAENKKDQKTPAHLMPQVVPVQLPAAREVSPELARQMQEWLDIEDERKRLHAKSERLSAELEAAHRSHATDNEVNRRTIEELKHTIDVLEHRVDKYMRYSVAFEFNSDRIREATDRIDDLVAKMMSDPAHGLASASAKEQFAAMEKSIEETVALMASEPRAA